MKRARSRAVPIVVAALMLLSAASARAEERSAWWSVGVSSGATVLDPSLSAYLWDTRLRAAFGGEALIGAGRWSLGARMWRTQTTQTVSAPGVMDSPVVRATSLEAVGRVRIAAWQGLRLEGMASAGRRHLGYSPDELAIDIGTGTPTRVMLAPLDEWVASGGVSAQHTVRGSWDLGLQVEHGVFGLDTAHRAGAGIETRRESFGEWNARLALARRFQLR